MTGWGEPVLYAAGDRVEIDVAVPPKWWRRVFLREKPRVERRVHGLEGKPSHVGEVVESEG